MSEHSCAHPQRRISPAGDLDKDTTASVNRGEGDRRQRLAVSRSGVHGICDVALMPRRASPSTRTAGGTDGDVGDAGMVSPRWVTSCGPHVHRVRPGLPQTAGVAMSGSLFGSGTAWARSRHRPGRASCRICRPPEQLTSAKWSEPEVAIGTREAHADNDSHASQGPNDWFHTTSLRGQHYPGDTSF